MESINNKNGRRKEFCVAQIIKEAEKKLSIRDLVKLTNLLNKMKDINRIDEQ
tara:strand:- start:909 stop:1064 length:156 start_codon:yes stop_codon:yes gene_type:complete